MRAAWLVALAACGYPALPKIAPGDGNPGTTVTKLVTNDLDLLLVVDNSASIVDKQTVLAASFPQLAAALDAFPGGRPNLHIGVVSTTVGITSTAFPPGCPATAPMDDGLLQNTPRVSGCSPPTGRFISDIGQGSGTRQTNYAGTLDQALSCIAQLGATGCGFEHQLEGMKRALDGSRPENAGFLRPQAVLGILMLTDEDDCSTQDDSIFSLNNVGPGDFRCQPLYAYTCDQMISAVSAGSYTNCTPLLGSYLRAPADYAAFLANVKPPGEYVVTVIGGDTQTNISTGPITTPFNQMLALLPSCMATINGNMNVSRPGIRLSAFTSALGDAGLYRTACQPSYTPPIMDAVKAMFHAMGPCLDSTIDLTDIDAANPGTQPACTVTQNGVPVPACQMADASTVAAGSPMPCVLYGASPMCPMDPLAALIAGGSNLPYQVTCRLK